MSGSAKICEEKSKIEDTSGIPVPGKLGVGRKKMKVNHPLVESRPRNLRIGEDIRVKVDLSRYMKWPRYVQLQRKKRVLQERLKIPPSLNQFNHTLNRNQSDQLFRLLIKYRPEAKLEKKERLLRMAKQLAAQNLEMTGESKNEKEASQSLAMKSKPLASSVSTGKPFFIKYGLNHVTDLIEYRKAKLVIIANDVSPIELVCWLPSLCRKKNITYCIVKGKARLGQLVWKKNAAVICLEAVRKEDQNEFENLIESFRAEFNENMEIRRKWGGGILGTKSQHAAKKQEQRILKERAKKATT